MDAKDLLSPSEAFVSYLVRSNGAAQVYVIENTARARWVDLGLIPNMAGLTPKAFGATSSGSNGVDIFTWPEASESKLLSLQTQGKLKDYKYLLFSAHGYLAQNPSLSALVLSQRGNPDGVDGYITASEWPIYDVRSDLTVLSACDTGVGKTQAGEGVMGLHHGIGRRLCFTGLKTSARCNINRGPITALVTQQA